MKIIQQYLCELCTNAIGRPVGANQVEFVVCAKDAPGFPIDRKCTEFILEEEVAS
jgi:hypothetical protein